MMGLAFYGFVFAACHLIKTFSLASFSWFERGVKTIAGKVNITKLVGSIKVK